MPSLNRRMIYFSVPVFLVQIKKNIFVFIDFCLVFETVDNSPDLNILFDNKGKKIVYSASLLPVFFFLKN